MVCDHRFPWMLAPPEALTRCLHFYGKGIRRGLKERKGLILFTLIFVKLPVISVFPVLHTGILKHGPYAVEPILYELPTTGNKSRFPHHGACSPAFQAPPPG